MLNPSDFVCVEFEQILKKTDSTMRVQFMDGQTEWIPFSQIDNPGAYHVMDHDDQIWISKWIAAKLGL